MASEYTLPSSSPCAAAWFEYEICAAPIAYHYAAVTYTFIRDDICCYCVTPPRHRPPAIILRVVAVNTAPRRRSRQRVAEITGSRLRYARHAMLSLIKVMVLG